MMTKRLLPVLLVGVMSIVAKLVASTMTIDHNPNAAYETSNQEHHNKIEIEMEWSMPDESPSSLPVGFTLDLGPDPNLDQPMKEPLSWALLQYLDEVAKKNETKYETHKHAFYFNQFMQCQGSKNCQPLEEATVGEVLERNKTYLRPTIIQQTRVNVLEHQAEQHHMVAELKEVERAKITGSFTVNKNSSWWGVLTTAWGYLKDATAALQQAAGMA